MEEVVIEGVVGGTLVVTGTSDPVNGFSNGSSVITCNGIDEKRIRMYRGMFQFVGIPGLGDFYVKYITDNFLILTQPLVTGEYIYIKTIPV